MPANNPSPDLFANLPDATQDHTRPVTERVAALVDALTLEEKVLQMVHSAPAVERLGIPPIKMTDGPNGARGDGQSGCSAVCFPVGSALASTCWHLCTSHCIL